tara:strand:+ start:125 stop:355 length:231 start_codon:yes stop_codon:yes gene_type:complete
MKKTEFIIYGSNGNRGVLKRTLYRDEKGDLFAKYFGKWWNYNKGEIEHYGIANKKTGEYMGVSFGNLGQDLTKLMR